MAISSINNLNRSTAPFDVGDRFKQINSKIRFLEERMNVGRNVKLSFSQFDKTPCARIKANTIELPTWFLFKHDDIPQQLRIDHLNDPRLVNPNFLKSLADWFNEEFRKAGLSSVVKPADHGSLQDVLKLMRDRNLFEKSKDFILAHELAHINHAQVDHETLYLHQLQSGLSAAGIIGGILLLFLAVSIIPFVPLSITLIVAGVSVAISTGAIIAWLNKTNAPVSPSAVAEEIKADMDALEALQDNAGGVYLFETYRAHNLAIRHSNSAARDSIDTNGNNLKDKNHPPLTDRIAYIRQWRPQQT